MRKHQSIALCLQLLLLGQIDAGINEQNADGKARIGQRNAVNEEIHDQAGKGEQRVNKERKAVDFCRALCENRHQDHGKEGKDREQKMHDSKRDIVGVDVISLIVDRKYVAEERVADTKSHGCRTQHTEYVEDKGCRAAVDVQTLRQIPQKADDGKLREAARNRVGHRGHHPQGGMPFSDP